MISLIRYINILKLRSLIKKISFLYFKIKKKAKFLCENNIYLLKFIVS